MTVLGIESSCDETSAAVLVDGVLRSNVISSQIEHEPYGGIVPELASRAHLRAIVPVIRAALDQAGVDRLALDAVAATQGPGLIGSLLVGLNAGKAMALGLDIPFIAVNHLEAHLFASHLEARHPEFPFLSLLVSGGHTLLVHVRALGDYRVMGATIDDAAGEAFDKVAQMLGLGFPGGPVIDRRASRGKADAFRFPRPGLDRDDSAFSFSGLKTAVLYRLRDLRTTSGGDALTEETIDDLCASFQQAVVDVLVIKTVRAARDLGVSDVSMGGGVSANSALRRSLHDALAPHSISLHVPRIEYTTDNAAMVALLGWMHLQHGAGGTLSAAAYARGVRSLDSSATEKNDRRTTRRIRPAGAAPDEHSGGPSA